MAFTHKIKVVFNDESKIVAEVVFDGGEKPRIAIVGGMELDVLAMQHFYLVIDALTALYNSSGGVLKFEVVPKV